MEYSIEITSKVKLNGNIGSDSKEVFVAWLPNEDFKSVLDKSIELFNNGYVPVPHISAKKVKDLKDINYISDSLSTITNKVLLIGGGGKLEGIFETVEDLVKTGAFDKFEIGVGGFPEGNGSLSYTEGIEILKEKSKYASFVVTQWSLDKKSVLKFLNDSPLPVYLGVPKKCSVKKLLNFAIICGIKNSVSGIISNPKNMLRFLFGFNPKFIINATKNHKKLDKIHIYSFGQTN